MRFIIAIVLSLFLFLPTKSMAQVGQFGGGDNGPVQIDAVDGIEWNRTEKTYTASGQVIAKQGNMTVNCEKLTAYYRDGKGSENSQIYQLLAEKDVVITTTDPKTGDTQKVVGDHAIYNVDTGLFRVTGDNLKLITPTEMITAEQSLEYQQSENVAYARGNAVINRTNNRLRADVLKAYFKEDAQGQLAIKDVYARDNVVITTPTDVARGQKGHYDAASGIATLIGGVSLTREDNKLYGDIAEVNLKTGISKLLSKKSSGGRVQALFKQKNEN